MITLLGSAVVVSVRRSTYQLDTIDGFSELQVHTESKPPYSFSCLIFMAIEDSPIKALPVKDIYGWIVDHFPYYKNAPTGWKNSVRHNLSLNKCFRKVEKAPVRKRVVINNFRIIYYNFFFLVRL